MAYVSRLLPPSLALEGTKLPFITHTCHHHYAHQRSLDSLGLHVLIAFPISVCFLCFIPVSALLSFSFLLSRRCPYSVMLFCPWLLNVHSLYLLFVSWVDIYRMLTPLYQASGRFLFFALLVMTGPGAASDGTRGCLSWLFGLSLLR